MEKNIEENHQNEQNKTFPMEYLPEQVVSEVFQYLDTKDLNQMAQASRDWKSMTENDTLRRYINSIVIEGKNIEVEHNVTRGIKYCDNLVLTRCTFNTKKFSRILKEIGGKLKSIQLIDCFITDNHFNKIFQHIADNCPLIESIEISSTNPKKFDLYKEADLEPLLACPNLHTIKIDGLQHQDYKIISKLLKKVWRFEYTYDQGSDEDNILYHPEKNAIYYIKYNNGFTISQVFPEPKESESNDVRGYFSSKFSRFEGSFKFNTYEVIDINEYDKTILIMDQDGNTEEYTPSAELFQEILEEMKENDACFISLARIWLKDTYNPSSEEFFSTIENGIMHRPPYWN
jgi:hypothetical protein